MRILNKVGFALLFCMFSVSIYGADITIIAPEYAGSSFAFYTVPNFLTEKQEIIGEATVSEAGELKIEFTIDQTLPIFSEFGIYKGWFVAEPGISYDLILPPKAENTSSNPYFRPKLIHIGIKNSNPESANTLIDDFNRQYNMEMSQNMNQIFYRRSLETAETVIESLKGRFPETSNEYFEQYKTYKYAMMKYMALIQDPTPIMEEYFFSKPILYHHPEYCELFDKLYAKYLQYATQQVDGQKISVMINSGSFDQLMDWLTLDMLFDKPLAEAVILKGVKPLFYSKRFNVVGLFNIMQKITETSEVEIHKVTSNKLFNELARTMYGAIAPDLSLLDTKGNMVSWEDFEGKFVYLCFTRSDNEKFLQHKELMKVFWENYNQNLALVIVLEDEDFEKNADLLSSEGFQWTILRGQSRREIYDSFNVRILPTYFLIDPMGRMAGSQAPWPDENFEMQFANILKATQD